MVSTPTPFFIEGGRGRLFAVHHAPSPDVEFRGNVLCVPPFNEEMNRCRSMLTLQAQAFARHGFGTLVVDLYGTGESDGEYGDARWEIWRDDVIAALNWLDGNAGGSVALLGVRLGVPLAAQVLRERSGCQQSLIAWQPVADGKTYFTQFLRMRIAANMDRTDIPKETTTGMRGILAAGQPIEVAGYEINPELASAIERLQLAKMPPPETVAVSWFEKISGATGEFSPASKTVIDAWQSGGCRVDAKGFEGQAFWALHDRVVAQDLIQLTTEWLNSVLAQK